MRVFASGLVYPPVGGYGNQGPFKGPEHIYSLDVNVLTDF